MTRRSRVTRLLTIISQVSLDAPLVAMTWQWVFADVTGASLRWTDYMILGGSVWCVYALDRVLDAAHLVPAESVASRHQFAYRHAPVLLLTCVMAIGLMILLSLLLLPLTVLMAWIVLGGLVFAYFILIHRIRPRTMWIPKEACVAVLFTSGAAVFPSAFQFGNWKAVPVPFLFVFLLLFGNAWSISKWERPLEQGDRQSSIAVDFPNLSAFLPIYLGLLALIGGLSPALGILPWWVGAAIGLSSLLLWLLDRYGSAMALTDRRELADLVLLAPLLLGPFR